MFRGLLDANNGLLSTEGHQCTDWDAINYLDMNRNLCLDDSTFDYFCVF